jgi:hypothetical protein
MNALHSRLIRLYERQQTSLVEGQFDIGDDLHPLAGVRFARSVESFEGRYILFLFVSSVQRTLTEAGSETET